MKIFSTLLLLLGSCLTAFAQNQTEDELTKMLDNEEFRKVIDNYAPKSAELSGKSLYYVGFAYFVEDDNDNCIKFMDLSIAKDASNPKPYFIKGVAYNYSKRYNDAVPCLLAAITLAPDKPDYQHELGEAYYFQKQYEPALESFLKAAAMEECEERTWVMLGQLYLDLEQRDKALESYYTAKEKAGEESGYYINILFNIGLGEIVQGDYTKAESAFLEIIRLNPEDYHSYAKLIQIYYHNKEYEKAKPYREQLYAAHKKGVLKDTNLEIMFCIDQFEWDGKQVMAFEKYQEGMSEDIYEKYKFFLLKEDGSAELTIQTEYTPFASKEAGKPIYILCMWKGNSHHNFGIYYYDDLDYGELKSKVLEVLDNKVTPAASLRLGSD